MRACAGACGAGAARAMPPPRQRAARSRRRRPRQPQAGAVAALLAGASAPWCCGGQLAQPGFKNQYYQSPGYMGTRILEHNVTGHYTESAYVEVTWSQSVAIDDQERLWIADKVYHVVVMVSKSDPYLDWAAFYYAYAGKRGVANHFDGTRLRARFDSPASLAVATVGGELYIYVADTNNHCIRRLDFNTGRTSTIVGYPKVAGLRDGPGQESRFRSPASLGIHNGGNVLFVVDNGRRIRHIQLDLTIPMVTTLADGACRAVTRWTVPGHESVVLRRVGCHTDWHARDTGDTSVDLYTTAWSCRGHNSTCGPRYFPALNDTATESRESQPPLEMIPDAAPARLRVL